MKGIKIFIIVILSCIASSKKGFAQQLQQITDTTINLNSEPSSQNVGFIKINLPEKTKGYAYRLSVFPKGSDFTISPLLSVLQSMGAINFPIPMPLNDMAIKSPNKDTTDFFIFSTEDQIT